MNKDRRKQLEDLIARLDDIEGELEVLKEEEQDYLDNMPESIQGGEKGDRANSAINSMENAVGSITDVRDSIQEAIDA